MYGAVLDIISIPSQRFTAAINAKVNVQARVVRLRLGVVSVHLARVSMVVAMCFARHVGTMDFVRLVAVRDNACASLGVRVFVVITGVTEVLVRRCSAWFLLLLWCDVTASLVDCFVNGEVGRDGEDNITRRNNEFVPHVVGPLLVIAQHVRGVECV